MSKTRTIEAYPERTGRKEGEIMRARSALSLAALVVALGVLVPSVALGEYAMIRGVPVTQGQMRIAEEDLERIQDRTPEAGGLFVLKETRVEAEIAGVLARVRVEHVFQNPYPERLEAVYIFPLPQHAAVDRYWFQVGEQVVRGVVKNREQARYDYEEAKNHGRKAALLEQERPDVFTQSVANIPPQGTITVHLEYVHPVGIDGDRYLFRFPMVVGPRFIPGQPVARPNVGRGWSPDTDEVPDASRITPAPLPEGMRHGNDVSITVKVDAGMPIQAITGVTHELDVEREEEATGAVIRLKNQTTIPNKDFVVEYRLAAEQPVLASLAHRGETGGYFVLVVQPKRQTETAELAAREVILLLDTSGSMAGPGISQLPSEWSPSPTRRGSSAPRPWRPRRGTSPRRSNSSGTSNPAAGPCCSRP
jgi:Ca-activated chloride channel family protein